MNEFQKTFFRVTTLEKQKNKTIRKEWVISVFDIICLLGVTAITVKAIIAWRNGSSLYEEITDGVRDWIQFLRSETQKLAESAGAIGTSIAGALTGPIGAGISSIGSGIGEIGKGLGTAAVAFGKLIEYAIGELGETLRSVIKDTTSKFDLPEINLKNLGVSGYISQVNALLRAFKVNVSITSPLEAIQALADLDKAIAKNRSKLSVTDINKWIKMISNYQMAGASFL